MIRHWHPGHLAAGEWCHKMGNDLTSHKAKNDGHWLLENEATRWAMISQATRQKGLMVVSLRLCEMAKEIDAKSSRYFILLILPSCYGFYALAIHRILSWSCNDLHQFISNPRGPSPHFKNQSWWGLVKVNHSEPLAVNNPVLSDSPTVTVRRPTQVKIRTDGGLSFLSPDTRTD